MFRFSVPQPLGPGLALAALLLAAGCAQKAIDANPDHYVGIGVELTMEAAGARVVRVIEGGPAAEAGLAKDDIVLEVEGLASRGKTLAEIVQALRGAPGSTVSLLARTHDGNKQLTVTRRNIENR